MKFKEYWKRFRTLDRRQDGFTLVELIVVIAILAILGGVAIPAYSGYVQKANKQADMTLVSEIVHAMTLRNYATQFANGQHGAVGYVVVTEGGAVSSGEEVDAAMKAAFGDSYNSLTLKHDGWTDAATMLNLVNNNAYAGSVNDSTYITDVGTEKLLGDVQNCATSFGSFLDKLHSGDKTAATNSMINGFTDQDTIKSMLAAAGYDSEEDYANVSPEVLQNITVLGVASAVKNNQGAVVESFKTGGALGKVEHTDTLDEIANWYAAAEALVAYMDDPTINAVFSGIDMSSGDAIVIANNMNGAYARIQELIAADTTEKLATKATDYYTKPGTNGKTQAQMDGEAYVGIMASVNELDDEYLSDEKAMNDGNLFAGGTLDNRVNSYVTAASLAGMINNAELQAILSGADSAAVVVAYANNGVLECRILPQDIIG